MLKAETLTGKNCNVNGADEEDAVFETKQNISPKVSSQNVDENILQYKKRF